MVVVYDSLTGQTKRFATKLGIKTASVIDYYGDDDKILLATRSFNFGEIPSSTLEFLDMYHKKVIGTVVSGNRNWGTNYGKAGELIEKIYHVPLILKFEGSGFIEDVELVKKFIKENEGKSNG